MTRADPSLELVRLSAAIAESLEAHDLDRAERLVEQRGRLLATTPAPAASPALAAAAEAVREADLRSHAALHAAIADVRRELGGLATGAAAMRAYDTSHACAPGFVDRRD